MCVRRLLRRPPRPRCLLHTEETFSPSAAKWGIGRRVPYSLSPQLDPPPPRGGGRRETEGPREEERERRGRPQKIALVCGEEGRRGGRGGLHGYRKKNSARVFFCQRQIFGGGGGGKVFFKRKHDCEYIGRRGRRKRGNNLCLRKWEVACRRLFLSPGLAGKGKMHYCFFPFSFVARVMEKIETHGDARLRKKGGGGGGGIVSARPFPGSRRRGRKEKESPPLGVAPPLLLMDLGR